LAVRAERDICPMSDSLTGTGKGGFPFKYDGRLQYTARQWYNLYMSSDDQRYLRGVSVAGYTGFGGHVYLMVTRFSNLARSNRLPRAAAEFVLSMRRPLARWLILLGTIEQVEKKPEWRRGLNGFCAVEVIGGSDLIWGNHPAIDGVKVTPPVQIGIPYSLVDAYSKMFFENPPTIRHRICEKIVFTSRHIVLGKQHHVPMRAWCYELEDCLRCGGDPSGSVFTGTHRYLERGETNFCALGMERGFSGFGVGQFGSLLSKESAELLLKSPEYMLVLPPVYSNIPCLVKVQLWYGEYFGHALLEHCTKGGLLGGMPTAAVDKYGYNPSRRQIVTHGFYERAVSEEADSSDDEEMTEEARNALYARRENEYLQYMKSLEAHESMVCRFKDAEVGMGVVLPEVVPGCAEAPDVRMFRTAGGFKVDIVCPSGITEEGWFVRLRDVADVFHPENSSDEEGSFVSAAGTAGSVTETTSLGGTSISSVECVEYDADREESGGTS